MRVGRPRKVYLKYELVPASITFGPSSPNRSFPLNELARLFRLASKLTRKLIYSLGRNQQASQRFVNSVKPSKL